MVSIFSDDLNGYDQNIGGDMIIIFILITCQMEEGIVN